MKRKYFSIILCFAIVVSGIFGTQKSRVRAYTVTDIPDVAVNLVTDIGTWAELGVYLKEQIKDIISEYAVVAMKIAALMVEQAATQAIIGGPKGDTMIHDYKSYLYTSPQQLAMSKMNVFFTTVTRGRASSANYINEGVNYDTYLVSQARKAISGSAFAPTLQNQVADPSQMLAGGNMRAFNDYFKCGNMVACFTLTAQAKYEQEFKLAQDLARTESDRGFMPRKVNGRITQPAILAQSALTQVDQLGTQIIMNTDNKAEIGPAAQQIAQGLAISTVARLTNYGISDEAGKEAIRNKNSQFPFSLAYSSKDGVGFSAGGVTINAGFGAMSSQVQIGNTCAQLYGDVNAAGATVDIQGKRFDCATKTAVNGSGPSVNISLPAITCTSTDACNSACRAVPGCAEKFGTLVCHPTTKKCIQAF